MHKIFKTASALTIATGLSGCVSTGTPVSTTYSGGSGWGRAFSSATESVAETQSTSAETNPGETSGPEGTTDSGAGVGFGSFSG